MPNSDAIPVEVIILTETSDIKGTVYVSKGVAANRQLTELLNDNNRRFLAVTNVEIYPKNSNQPPKRYEFLELHMDSILMVHPISQTLFKDSSKSQNSLVDFHLQKFLRHSLANQLFSLTGRCVCEEGFISTTAKRPSSYSIKKSG